MGSPPVSSLGPSAPVSPLRPSAPVTTTCGGRGHVSVAMREVCGTWMNRQTQQWGNAAWGAILQFGVLNGSSLRRFMQSFPGCPVWGFDSFRGLPTEAPGLLTPEVWQAGAFAPNASRMSARFAPLDAMKVTSELGGEAADGVLQTNGATLFSSGRVTIIPGFFDESLTAELAHRLLSRSGRASFIDIDSDLYLSARAALDFIFTHRIARVGTVIRYDDWWTLPCAAQHRVNRNSSRAVKGVGPGHVSGIASFGGEPLAHIEAAQRYRVSFACACGPCNHSSPFFSGGQYGYGLGFNPLFVVVGFGRADPGFNVSDTSMRDFLRRQKTCAQPCLSESPCTTPSLHALSHHAPTHHDHPTDKASFNRCGQPWPMYPPIRAVYLLLSPLVSIQPRARFMWTHCRVTTCNTTQAEATEHALASASPMGSPPCSPRHHQNQRARSGPRSLLVQAQVRMQAQVQAIGGRTEVGGK